jgi:hypothetical protein
MQENFGAQKPWNMDTKKKVFARSSLIRYRLTLSARKAIYVPFELTANSRGNFEDTSRLIDSACDIFEPQLQMDLKRLHFKRFYFQ